MSSTKASSVRSKLLLWSGNLSRLTLWWVTAELWLRATSTPSSKSLIYKKEKKQALRRSCDTGMRSAQSGDCVLPPAGARRYEANHRGIEGEHQAQCARVRRWREEHTLVKTQDGKLGITIQDPPPESGRRTHLLYFTHSFCILSCV